MGAIRLGGRAGRGVPSRSAAALAIAAAAAVGAALLLPPAPVAPAAADSPAAHPAWPRVLSGSRAPRAAEPAPSVGAAAAVLLDATTGQILFEKRAHERRPPASTTKIMTAILALEMGRLDETVTVSARAAHTEGSSMYLRPGDRYPLRDLLAGLLLVSGNDAAVAIAEHIGGSVENFAILMTARARSLGLEDTRFRNPHGLTEGGHFSSAFDLAMMARHALGDRRFSDLVCRGHAEACGVDRAGGRIVQDLLNTNRLLFSYQWADGVKTGTTAAAGNCLVASATRYGQRLIAVVLDSPDRWGETARLLDWGFRNYALRTFAPAGEAVALVPVRGGRVDAVQAAPAWDVTMAVPRRDLAAVRTAIDRDPNLRAPVARGQRVGSLTVLGPRGTVWARVPLIARAAVERAPWWQRLMRALAREPARQPR